MNLRVLLQSHFFRPVAIAIAASIAAAWPMRLASAGEWEGTAAVGSDNVNRGLTQSAGDPALMADLHWRSEAGWIAGLGVATVNLSPGPGAPLEFATYVGRVASFNEQWSGRLTATHYEYPGDQQSLHYSYDELMAELAWRDRAFLILSYSPNTSRFTFAGIAVHRSALSAETVVRLPFTPQWEGRLGVGHYALASPVNQGYWYWNAMVDLTRDRWQLELGVIGTDRHASRLFGETTAGQRWVVTLIRRFGGSL